MKYLTCSRLRSRYDRGHYNSKRKMNEDFIINDNNQRGGDVKLKGDDSSEHDHKSKCFCGSNHCRKFLPSSTLF